MFGDIEDGMCNVFVGCPLASLAYARAINSPFDFAGTRVEIRDAYLFGAPVVGNQDCSLGESRLFVGVRGCGRVYILADSVPWVCVLAFNARMRGSGRGCKTLWRVTHVCFLG